MPTTAFAKITLTPGGQQLLQGLAGGHTLAVVATRLNIQESTAMSYIQEAKRRLHGISEIPAALAVAYATGAIAQPKALDPEKLDLPSEQSDLLPLIARGLRTALMATELDRPIGIVRRDVRGLMTNLQARNPAHIVTRAWQYRLLTTEQVLVWLP